MMNESNIGLDLIDRQAAIEALFDWEMAYDWDDHCREEDPKPEYIVSPSDVIEHLPSAQPEIIRCEDCKHWIEGPTNSYCYKLYKMGVFDIYDYMTTEYDFCSRAERRTDESNVQDK